MFWSGFNRFPQIEQNSSVLGWAKWQQSSGSHSVCVYPLTERKGTKSVLIFASFTSSLAPGPNKKNRNHHHTLKTPLGAICK